jgi:roadblock/LC7 domain-containing protein
MRIKGAVAAGQYKLTGELVAYKGEIPKEVAEMVAEMCAANTMMAKMQADVFTAFSKMNWKPLIGWAVAAGEYAVCVIGEYGVFVKLNEADFNEIFKTLREVAGI